MSDLPGPFRQNIVSALSAVCVYATAKEQALAFYESSIYVHNVGIGNFQNQTRIHRNNTANRTVGINFTPAKNSWTNDAYIGTTLNTVRAILKDSRMREQAHVIQVEVQKMMEDVGRLDDRVGKLQTHFDQATKDIRDIRISADKISKRGDKIEDLQLSDDSPAEDLAPAQAPAQPTLRVLGSEDQ